MSDRDDAGVYRVLDLFSGLGGFSKAFEESDRWKVTTVDIDGDFEPDVTADVLDLRPSDFDEEYDLILASPPCKTFSKAAAWHGHYGEEGTPQTSEARKAVALVYHTLGLIRALDPDYWFLENPEGHLRKFLGQPTGRVTFCQYGSEYMKPTDLWGEHPPMTYRRCRNGDDCHLRSRKSQKRGDGNHPADALPRDPADRAKVPYELSDAIREAVEAEYDNPAPGQVELSEVTTVAE